MSDSSSSPPDVLNEAFEFIGLLTPEGIVVDANQPALDFCGVSLLDVAGRPFWETPWWSWSSAEQARLEAGVREAASGHFVRYVAQHRAADGTFEDIDFSLTPVTNAAGTVIFLIPEGRRVTEFTTQGEQPQNAPDGLRARLAHRLQELAHANRALAEHRERLERAEALNRSLVQTAVDGIIVIDRSGRIELFNQAAERLFGYAAHEMAGLNISTLMPAPDRDQHDEYITRYLETNVPRIIGIGRDVEALHRDGHTFPIRLSISEMIIGGDRKFTGIVHDLTARRRAEDALREQATLVQLGQMAAVVAHEVRNPIAGVRGVLDVLIKRRSPDDAERAIMVEMAERLMSLDHLVDDLLVFARPKALRLAPTALLPILASSASVICATAQFERIDIRLPSDDAPIMADADALGRSFINLLINAAQAMNGEGVITITTELRGAHVIVTVTDKGPGMSIDVQQRLFEPFYTTKKRGTGLGLLVTRRAITQHGGVLAIVSTPGEGTQVTVRLPLLAAPAAGPA